MSYSQRRHESEGKTKSRPLDRSSLALAEITELNRLNEEEAYCSDGKALDISPEANIELQRTISEVGRCTTGNERLATICSRYVEALNEKHRLAQRLREEQAFRAKVLETKNRLVGVCRRLQEQTLELRREACGEEWTPNGDNVVKRTPLGMVRKYVDYTRFVDKSHDAHSFQDGETVTKSEVMNPSDEKTIRKKRSMQSDSAPTETNDTTDCKRKSSACLSKVENSEMRLETQIAALLKATSEARLSAKGVAEMNIAPKLTAQARKCRLSLVAVTRSDIPPATQGCSTDRKIGVSWASMDLTKR